MYTYYRPHTEYDGRLCFYRCLSVNRGRGVPRPSPDGGRRYPKVPTPQPGPDEGYPRYLPPSQITYPHPGPHGGRGYPPLRYLPPKPRYLSLVQVQMGERHPKVPTPCQDTYPHPPSSSRWGRGYPKVPTPIQVQTGRRRGTPRYLPPTKVPTPLPG